MLSLLTLSKLTFFHTFLASRPHHLHRRVLGVDATAAQTFGTLVMVLRRMGVELVLTRVTSRTMRRLFAAHGLIHPRYAQRKDEGHGAAVVGPEESPAVVLAMEQKEEEEDEEGRYCRLFDTLNEGAQYAEDK